MPSFNRPWQESAFIFLFSLFLYLYVYLCVCTSSTAANKAQVIESGHLILDGGRGVAKLSWVVLIISRHHCYQGAIRDVAQGNNLVIWRRKGKEKMEFWMYIPVSMKQWLLFDNIMNKNVSVYSIWNSVFLPRLSQVFKYVSVDEWREESVNVPGI